jgi:hypothetical protein
MFIATLADAAASTDFDDDNSAVDSAAADSTADSAAAKPCPVADSPAHSAAHPPEAVRHLLFGNAATVQATIKHLHKLRYAEANDWSEPMATGRPNEVMAVLTKRALGNEARKFVQGGVMGGEQNAQIALVSNLSDTGEQMLGTGRMYAVVDFFNHDKTAFSGR